MQFAEDQSIFTGFKVLKVPALGVKPAKPKKKKTWHTRCRPADRVGGEWGAGDCVQGISQSYSGVNKRHN